MKTTNYSDAREALAALLPQCHVRFLRNDVGAWVAVAEVRPAFRHLYARGGVIAHHEDPMEAAERLVDAARDAGFTEVL